MYSLPDVARQQAAGDAGDERRERERPQLVERDVHARRPAPTPRSGGSPPMRARPSSAGARARARTSAAPMTTDVAEVAGVGIGRSSGRRTAVEPVADSVWPRKPAPPLGKFVVVSATVIAPASISVMSARNRPLTRSAGSPTSVPSAAVTSPAESSTSGCGSDVANASRAATHAPSARIATWPSETRPDAADQQPQARARRPSRSPPPSSRRPSRCSAPPGRRTAGRARARRSPRAGARPRARSRTAISGARGRRDVLAREHEQRDHGEHERRHVAVLRDRQDRRDQRVDEADGRSRRRA